MLVTETVPAGRKPYSLPDAVREILNTTGLSDPQDIARELIRRMPATAIAETLEAVMPLYVRQRIGAERALTSPRAAQGVLVRSSKVGGITTWWRQVLEDSVRTSNGYKRLADCTRDDLTYLANGLRNSADAMLIKAQRYDNLGALLEGRGPYATLRTLLAGNELTPERIQNTLGELPGGGDSIDIDDED